MSPWTAAQTRSGGAAMSIASRMRLTARKPSRRRGETPTTHPRSGTWRPCRAYSRWMDDEALLERARRGDRDAFASIVTRHQDELYTMALRLLGTPHDAADVVQETFLRAYS